MKESTFYLMMIILFVISIASGIIGKNWEGFAFAGLVAILSLFNYIMVKRKK